MSFDPNTNFPGFGFGALLTAPTYDTVEDSPPNSHSKQFAVTTLGGTQTGVGAHSVSSPFTITIERPANIKVLGTPNPITGVIANVPRNVFTVRTRKGVVPLAGQPVQVAMIETKFSIPAGTDLADVNTLAALNCAHIGVLRDMDNEILGVLQDGVL